ncbi:MAG: hypothetical protein KGM44_06215, partial [bacterium]|nr:hypothetical protein [bacterium]
MQPPRVMLATLASDAFDDPHWIFETKWDGVRALCHIDRTGRMTLVSRTGQDLAGAFPDLAALAGAFSGAPLTVDGEIVALDEHGISSFQRLQARLNRAKPTAAEVDAVPVRFVVFDLLQHRGRETTALPLEERKALLKAAVKPRRVLRGTRGIVTLSGHVRGKGVA